MVEQYLKKKYQKVQFLWISNFFHMFFQVFVNFANEQLQSPVSCWLPIHWWQPSVLITYLGTRRESLSFMTVHQRPDMGTAEDWEVMLGSHEFSPSVSNLKLSAY